jgi:hypothetical protein
MPWYKPMLGTFICRPSNVTNKRCAGSIGAKKKKKGMRAGTRPCLASPFAPHGAHGMNSELTSGPRWRGSPSP